MLKIYIATQTDSEKTTVIVNIWEDGKRRTYDDCYVNINGPTVSIMKGGKTLEAYVNVPIKIEYINIG